MAKWLTLLLLLPPAALADDWAAITWAHPTTLTNGMPLSPSAIVGTRIEYGLCEGLNADFPAVHYNWFSLAGLQTQWNAANLAPGLWCFRLRTYSTYGTSEPSITVRKTITVPCGSGCHA